jgi:hypothetical protein
MPDYLVLHRPEGSTDPMAFAPVMFHADRKSTEVEQVIEESATAGAGDYLAVSMGASTLRTSGLVLSDPEAEGE